MKVSVIDLGFNSLKLVTYGVREDKSFYVIEQKSVAARLGEGLTAGGYLQLEPMHRTIEGLELFKEILYSESIKHVLPIGTSAVREAKNSDEFLKQVRRETGFTFRVLSEKEEALYSYTGAFRSIFEPNVLFFDLGGGSLELVHTANYSIRKVLSLPLGALRLTQDYANKNRSFSKKGYAKMMKYISSTLPSSKQLGLKQKTELIGVGGTARALASFDQEINDYPLNKIHRYTLSKESLEFIQAELVESKVSEIAKLDCIGDDRAKTIAAGATVVSEIMDRLDFRELVVSTQGLRDGILTAFLENPHAYYRGKSVEMRSLIRSRKSIPLPYSGAFIAALLALDQIDKKEFGILTAAAAHVLGGLPPYRPHALFYILMDEDVNMSHESQLIMALSIVRMLRPKTADWLYEKFKSIARPSDKNVIRKITTLLRFATLAEKSNSRVRARKQDHDILVEIFPAAGKVPFPVELFRRALLDLGQILDVAAKIHHKEFGMEQSIELARR